MSKNSKKQRLGFIGLGKMGGPIAAQLIKHGNPVTVFDINERAVERAVKLGARRAASAKAVGDEAEIVFLCLPEIEAVREVAIGANGVCQGRSVEILVDCSTTGPQFASELGAELAKRKITMLDSPVSGGIKRAAQGDLTLIMSGDLKAFKRVKPILQACGQPHYMGAKSGQAQMMKLVNNLLSQIATAATYEAFVLGAKAGLDPDAMVDVINNSTGMNNCTQFKMPRSVLPRTFDYGSNMEITYKDISLCMKEADRLGVTMLLGNTARQLWGYGVNHGGAKRDSSTLITHLEKWAGVKVIGKAGKGRS
jgi:3-hydroxyisobutyrate dehydrogenase-like beta-hydroxyacid dehydrogenase